MAHALHTTGNAMNSRTTTQRAQPELVILDVSLLQRVSGGDSPLAPWSQELQLPQEVSPLPGKVLKFPYPKTYESPETDELRRKWHAATMLGPKELAKAEDNYHRTAFKDGGFYP